MLEAKAFLDLLSRLQHDGDLPRAARLYVGDSIAIPRADGEGVLKGADLHV